MQRFRYYEIKYSATFTLTYSIFWLIYLSHWVSCGWLEINGKAPNIEYESAVLERNHTYHSWLWRCNPKPERQCIDDFYHGAANNGSGRLWVYDW